MRRTVGIGYAADMSKPLVRPAAGLSLLLCALARCAGAAEIHVSPAGNDAHPGTAEQPLRTLSRAAATVGPGDVCILHGGVYRETLMPARSGEPGRPIVFRAADGETPLISGADPVNGWRAESNGLWSAAMPWDLADRNQVFAGGHMLDEARWPDPSGAPLQPARAEAKGGGGDTLTDPALPGGAGDWTGALLWCAGGDRWICWSATVTAYAPATHTLSFKDGPTEHWYTVRPGNPYVLMGVRAALDAPGEWWRDPAAGRLWLCPPANLTPTNGAVEAKARTTAIDLSGRSHVQIVGIRLHAAGLRTTAATRHIRLERLHGAYLAHSYRRDTGHAAVTLLGEDLVLRDSELAFCSDSLVTLGGRSNKVVNCHLHDGNYRGSWHGVVAAAGRNQVLAWNTIREAGRDVLSVGGLTESLIEHNDLSHCGRLTSDLGLTYGHSTDFGNTEIRFNHVHDNVARGLGMGIYFDHLSQNVLVHHNAIWNIPGLGIQVNNPSHFCLVASNVCWKTNQDGKRPFTSFDHTHRQDLFGCRFEHNRVPAPFKLPENALVTENTVTNEQLATPPWPAGYDPRRTDTPEPTWIRPTAPHLNLLHNSAFEYGTLESWEPFGAGRATLGKGYGWGNRVVGGVDEPTGTCAHELCLAGQGGVRQAVAGLKPGTAYQLSGWLRVSSATETAVLEVTGHGGEPAAVRSAVQGWKRVLLDFTTGPGATSATVTIRREGAADGVVRADNFGLVERDLPVPAPVQRN